MKFFYFKIEKLNTFLFYLVSDKLVLRCFALLSSANSRIVVAISEGSCLVDDSY